MAVKRSRESTKVETKTESDEISTKLIKKVLKSVLKQNEENNDKSNDSGKMSIFDDAANHRHAKKKVNLNITSFKVPTAQTPVQNRPLHTNINRFDLPHGLTDATTSVLLVTRDYPKKGADTILSNAHHQTMLTNAGCNMLVTEIMTVSQLKAEHKERESLKNLCNRIDIVLCDSSTVKIVPRILGKPFQTANKFPISVTLGAKDLKKEFERKLNQSSHKMTFKNTQSSLCFGLTTQTMDELSSNLSAALGYLESKFPGGWQNVQTLYVSAGLKAKAPLYISQGSGSEVADVTIQTHEEEVFEGDFGFGNVKITSSGRLLDYTPDSDDEIFDKELVNEKKRRKLQQSIDEKGYLPEKEINEEIKKMMRGQVTHTVKSVKKDSKKDAKKEVENRKTKKMKTKRNKGPKEYIFTTPLDADIN